MEREAAAAVSGYLVTIRKPRRVAVKAPNTPPLPKSLRWGLSSWRRRELSIESRSAAVSCRVNAPLSGGKGYVLMRGYVAKDGMRIFWGQRFGEVCPFG